MADCYSRVLVIGFRIQAISCSSVTSVGSFVIAVIGGTAPLLVGSGALLSLSLLVSVAVLFLRRTLSLILFSHLIGLH